MGDMVASSLNGAVRPAMVEGAVFRWPTPRASAAVGRGCCERDCEREAEPRVADDSVAAVADRRGGGVVAVPATGTRPYGDSAPAAPPPPTWAA